MARRVRVAVVTFEADEAIPVSSYKVENRGLHVILSERRLYASVASSIASITGYTEYRYDRLKPCECRAGIVRVAGTEVHVSSMLCKHVDRCGLLDPLVIITWSNTQPEDLGIPTVRGIISSVSIYANYRGRGHILTALTLPGTMSNLDVYKCIASKTCRVYDTTGIITDLFM